VTVTFEVTVTFLYIQFFPRLEQVKLLAEDGEIQSIRGIGITADSGDFRAHRFEPLQPFGEDGFAKPMPLVLGDGGDRLEVRCAGDIVKPDGTEGGDGTITGNGDNIEIAAVERRRLDVVIPTWVVTIFAGGVNVVVVEAKPRSVTAFEQFQSMPKRADGVAFRRFYILDFIFERKI
jgi:hypothetical protein